MYKYPSKWIYLRKIGQFSELIVLDLTTKVESHFQNEVEDDAQQTFDNSCELYFDQKWQ